MTATPIAETVRALISGLGSAEAVVEAIGGGLTTRSVQRHAAGSCAPPAKLAAKYVALHARRHEKMVDDDETTVTPAAFDMSRPTLEAVISAATEAAALYEKAKNDPDASYRDRTGALHALSRMLRDLASLRGELEPTEASILRTPAWARLRDATLAALSDYPDAAKALLGTWQTLEGA